MAYGDSTKGLESDDARADTVRTLQEYRKMFDDYRWTTEQNRMEACIDIDYYDGKQYTADDTRALDERGQPIVPINRTRVAINGILGVTSRARADPRCWPRTPKDEDGADVATDVLRFISQQNRFAYTRVDVFKDILIPGTAGILININDDKEVLFTQVRWEELFIDPRSRRVDGKDARYIGIAKWMYSSDLANRYPDFDDELDDAMTSGIGGVIDESFEDRPVNIGSWLDQRNKRVMVVELYHKHKNEWYKCVYYGGGVLEEGICDFKDDKGRSCCPIEVTSAYMDRENNRYGAVRDMRPLQDEINKRRSKLLHLLSSSQIQARDPSAIEVDADTARIEAARPDGVIPYGWEKVTTTDMSQGQMQLLAESKSEMERFGPNPAILGRQGSDSSGRALLTRQQAGLVELAILFDRLEDLELRCYRQAWARVRQYWTEAQFIRITDDIESARFVGINQPAPSPVMDPNTGQPAVDPESGEPMQGPPQFHPPVMMDLAGQVVPHPQAGQSVFGYTNEVATMDVDIIVDTQPETSTIMAEQLKDLTELVASNPTYAQQVPFEVMIEMTALPRKRELIGKIRKFREEANQASAQQQQQQMQMAIQEAMSKIKVNITKAGLNEAEAELALAEARATMLTASAKVSEVAHRALNDEEHPRQPKAPGKPGT